ncbi:DUF2332 domain-containing protein [Nocardiopsis xinjiangensis]|uniref:DUF2332 domain-containing protein n=1 Tax=Nocardiopsis xinjiangensis TaxID=124285 RepID=UPI0003486621|nr:DUF2332 domain-containing protein [Nocardiopsis xinjiangensis]
MTSTIEQVIAGCEWQRDLCRKNGAPTYVALINELIERLGADDTVTDLLTSDGQNPVQSALCLRLFGAVNRIAMDGSEDWITRYYPTMGGEADPDRVVPAFFDFLLANVDSVREQMRVAVQTNEVGRAAPLSAAVNYVAHATGRPLRLLEVGSSAGLNLLLDHYRVEGPHGPWGPADSALRLEGHFTSGEPQAAVPEVVERRGCDLNPIDVHAPGTPNLLRSFVWPEHVERARRLEAALTVARSAPPLTLDAADACSWVAEHVDDPEPGRTTVLFHSIVLPYFDPDERDRFSKLVRSRGEQTDEDRPLAWISLEPSEEDSSVVNLICEIWPMGRKVLLARTTPHGTQVHWDPQELLT